MWSQLEEHPEGKPQLLLVDDDPLVADTLAYALGADFEVLACATRAQAIERVRRLARPPQLALVDLGLPPTADRPDEGFQLIADLLAHSSSMKIFVLSGQSDEANARHARTLGAAEFLAKPCRPATLKAVLARALELRRSEIARGAETDGDIVGESPSVAKLRTQIAQFADLPFPVLIEGESGSGKKLAAQKIHVLSRRAPRPLLMLNCAALPPAVVEATLFGYAKGAFPEATVHKAGALEDAQDGTLVLNQLGELPPEAQAKLLQVLESGQYQRVGEPEWRVARARIVATSPPGLSRRVARGGFRADLYHRLSVLTLGLPPLRDLGRDKLLLLEHYKRYYAAHSGLQPFTLDAAAEARWLEYPFSGNVRELRNVVIRLATRYGGRTVSPRELDPELDAELAVWHPATREGEAVEEALRHLERTENFRLDETLGVWESAYIAAALRITNGNVSQAARLLGMNRTTLYSRMQAASSAAQPAAAETDPGARAAPAGEAAARDSGRQSPH